MGIISGSGSFRGQFGDHFRVGDHFGVGIISGAVQIASVCTFPINIIKSLTMYHATMAVVRGRQELYSYRHNCKAQKALECVLRTVPTIVISHTFHASQDTPYW